MTKQTPHTDTRTRTYPASFPRGDDSAAANRRKREGRGHFGPAPWRYVTGAGPWVRATSREAVGVERGAVQPGFHVRRAGWAAGWAAGGGSTAPAGQSPRRRRRSVCPDQEPGLTRREVARGRAWPGSRRWRRWARNSSHLTLLVRDFVPGTVLGALHLLFIYSL